ncbi:terpene cyclase/mutase family protein [Candidatus Woesearchaeota archaeon]|jgi:prenyltransferase beta subunit|nr:terpene cyclase/mutase family protein [Candidatus Woesearchaeota archaeon]MBT4387246.1 terpene cyclase/mutase family protein [Candidatus Woesearchaeota archaeon]MBT4596247.1 terpene cyclase/mutase family protein [Candidatus Woesearchaeota archaeon]MBT5741530.1 terpene cyclase/mutase family protein [Candidatus Woesearchaeota archaeon]MBT6505439.1 terpene cyclase/mutase family protein [Candidatus Woesearchaeota archaeon]
MNEIEIIDNLINKTCKEIVKFSNEDGSFIFNKDPNINIPPFFDHTLVRTSEAIRILIYSQNIDYLPHINKSLLYCLNFNFSADTEINFLCSKLKVIRFLDNSFVKKRQKKIIDLILDKQCIGGYWGVFPDTYNLLNFSIVDPLYLYNSQKINASLLKLVKWFYMNRAKDKLGWGYNQNSEKSQNSYTANVLFSILRTNQNYNWEIIDEALDFLISNQNSDGGFSSSDTTINDQSTVYATSLSLICLLVLKADPFNSNVKKAFNFLIKHSLKSGGWGLIKSDKKIQIYTSYYATYALKLYKYFSENYFKSKFDFVDKTKDFNIFLFFEFENEINNGFKNSLVKFILNSNIYGSSLEATKRRKKIVDIFYKNGILEVGDVINLIKKYPKYKNITKKYHITLIKSDLDHLNKIGILVKHKNKYCLLGNFNIK